MLWVNPMKSFNVKGFVDLKQNEEEPEKGGGILNVPGRAVPAKGSSVTAAVFRQENIFASFVNNRSWHKEFEPEEGYNWLDGMPRGYEDYASRFVLARSKKEANNIRNQIDSENQDKSLLGDHPIQSFFTGFIANALDPTILLPGTGFYKAAKGYSKAALATVDVGVSAGVQGVAQELLLHPTQQARTIEESQFNVMASMALGSALGGAASFISTRNGIKTSEQMAKILDTGEISPPAKITDDPLTMTKEAFDDANQAITSSGDGSLGAAKVTELEGDELLMNRQIAKIYGETLGRTTSLSRGLTSPFKTVRAFIPEILENNLFLKKNTAAYGNQSSHHALETKIKESYGASDKALSEYMDVFYEMNGLAPDAFGRRIRHALDPNKKVVSYDDYVVGVWRATISGASDNPGFMKAANILKEKIFEPWKDKMIEIGELPPNVDPKTAINYFTRMYNVDKINDPRFRGSYEVDDNNTFYTRVKNYVLRINDVLKEQRPAMMELETQISKLQSSETRLINTKKEADRLRQTAEADKEAADTLMGEAFDKNKDKAQPAIDKWIEKNRLSEQDILEIQENLNESKTTLETLNQIQKDKQLHADDLKEFNKLQEQIAKAEQEKADAVKWLEKQISDIHAENKALKEEARAYKEETGEPLEIKLKKTGILQEKLNKAKAVGTERVKAAKNNLGKFESSFSEEKLRIAKRIARLEESIRSAEKIKEIELRNIGKSIDAKRNEIVKILKEREKYIYRKVDRLSKLDERLAANPIEPVTKAKKDLEKKLKEDFIPDLFNSKGKVRTILEGETDVRATVESIIDNITGLNDNRYSNPLLRGIDGTSPNSTKNRHFLIPDEELDGFMIIDPSRIVPMYTRGVVPHYHITKWAQEQGFDKGTEFVKHRMDEVMAEYKKLLLEAVKPAIKEKLQAKYNPLLEEAKDPLRPDVWTDKYRQVMQTYTEELKKSQDPKYADFLTRRFKEAENDIKSSLQILMGLYGNGANVVDTKISKLVRTLGQYNFLRMMGYMVSSSFTDPGMIVAKNGFASFVHEGMLPIIKGLKSAKINKQLALDFGRAGNAYIGVRLSSMIEQKGLAQETGLFPRAFKTLVDTFGNVTGMSYWMDAMQYMASNVSISRTLRTIDNIMTGKKVKESDILRLNQIGISKSDMAKIHEQFKLHGGQEEGSYFINWAEWDTNSKEGLESLNSFKYATLKDLDATIVVPGVGDKPLAAHQWYGQMILQFKTFALGATNKLLISGLQRRDAEFAQGVISLLALGELVYCFNKIAKNQEISDDPAVHMHEMIDRSGLMGILMEVPQTLQKIGLMPGTATSRYTSRGPLSSLFGPTLGSLEDFVYLLNRFRNANETPLTTKDADKILKFAPLNNVWYLDALNRRLGLTKSLAMSAGFEEAE